MLDEQLTIRFGASSSLRSSGTVRVPQHRVMTAGEPSAFVAGRYSCFNPKDRHAFEIEYLNLVSSVVVVGVVEI